MIGRIVLEFDSPETEDKEYMEKWLRIFRESLPVDDFAKKRFKGGPHSGCVINVHSGVVAVAYPYDRGHTIPEREIYKTLLRDIKKKEDIDL